MSKRDEKADMARAAASPSFRPYRPTATPVAFGLARYALGLDLSLPELSRDLPGRRLAELVDHAMMGGDDAEGP